MKPEHDDVRRPVIDHDTQPPSPAAMPTGGKLITMAADVRIIRNHLKEAVGARSTEKGGNTGEEVAYSILSDEPEHLGGDGAHPQPLLYIAAGIGF